MLRKITFTLLSIIGVIALGMALFFSGRQYEASKFPECGGDMECWCKQSGGEAFFERRNLHDGNAINAFACITLDDPIVASPP